MSKFEEKKLTKVYDNKIILKLYSYTKKYLIVLLIAILLLSISTFSEILRPKIVGNIIDSINPIEKSQVITNAEKLNTILKSISLLFILAVVAFVCSAFQVYLLSFIGQNVIYKIRSDLFIKLQRMSLSFHEKNPVGRLVTRMTNDLNTINELYSEVIVTVLTDLIVIIGSVAMMIYIDYRLAIASLLVTLPVYFIMQYFRTKIREVYRVVRQKISAINSALNENITGMRTIQLFNQEKRFIEEFDNLNSEYKEISTKELKLYTIFRPTVNFFYFLTLSVAILYGGYLLINNQLKVGVIIAFTMYIRQLYRPILDLAEKFNIFQSSIIAIERVFLLLEYKENLINHKRIKPNNFKGNVCFKNVSFGYNKDELVLKNISFDVKKGETIAFVGATGSGKTTIIKLLTRFYDIEEGEILIDNIPIKDYDINFLRDRITPVFQDVFLFSGDIRSNIAMFDKSISDKRIKKALDFVNASEFIFRHKEGLDYRVSEEATSFSQGQRQLLSFARAIVKEPDILILDEATSSIDSHSEDLIQEATEKIMDKRTNFVIAHRLSTIKNADKIIVMHKGEIYEIGTHEELLEKNSMYADLYRLQYE